MARPAKRDDERMIEIFAAFLNTLGSPIFNVIEWPEDTRKPNQIDALVGPLAIEHTSIDALPAQREMNARFTEFIGEIEARTRGNLGFRIRIDIPFDALKKGLARRDLNKAMLDWIEAHSKSLPDGIHENIRVPGIPFPIMAVKGGPIKTDGVIFARRFQDDPDFYLRIRGVIARKLPKLAMHRSRARKAVLLVESDDIALMTSDYFACAFDLAYPKWPESLDELWFAHRVSGADIVFSDLRTTRAWSHSITTQTTRAFP